MIWQDIKMAFISIRSAKLRSFLTILGIIIGVSSVVLVIAVGEGVKASVREQVTDLGTNLVQVNPGQAIDDSDDGSGEGGFNFLSTLGASTLTEKDIIVVKNTTGVEAVAPFMFISGILTQGTNKAPNAIIGATTPEYITALNQTVEKGRFFTSSENETKVIVLGAGVAKKLFGDQNPIGKSIALRGEQLQVVGVMKELESGFSPANLNDVAYIPFGLGKTFSNGVANISEIEVKVSAQSNVEDVVTKLKAALKESHSGTVDFTVTTAEDQLKVFDQIFSILTTFIAAIAAISLLVGGIGIMNIMLVSVTERTREIGIRKAIGATSGSIMFQFLLEAIFLSALGGAIGIGLAYLGGLLVKQAIDITPVFGVSAFVLAFGVSFVVGVVFGTAPAIKAARKRPIQALKAL